MDAVQILGTRLDYYVIIAYFILIFGFGFFFARFTRSTRDFFFGGQRFSWWLITFSCVATVVGSYSFVKYSAAGFRYGMSSSMSYLNDWIVMSFLLLGWIPIIYFNRIGSVPEYFKKRFDQKTAVAATVIILIYMVGYIGINLYTMGVALNAMLGTDIFLSAVVVAVICGAYVTLGGQTSVIMTDLAQGCILLFAGFLLFFLGLNLLGGWESFWSGLPLLHKLPFARFNEPHQFNFVGIFWQDGIANTFALYMMNQGIILRFLSLKSARESRKTFLALILILMPLAAFAVSNAGWLGKAMVSKGLLPESVDPNQIFVVVADKVCSPGLFGFVMAALTAALMSTIDTLINAVSSIAVNDIYKPYFKDNASDRHYLKTARITSLLTAILGIALVPVFSSFRSIYVAHGSFTASITPPMVVAILLGMIWKKMSPQAAFWSLVGGSMLIAGSIAWPVLVLPFSHGVDPAGGFKYTRALFGLVVCGIIAVIVNFFSRRSQIDRNIHSLIMGGLKNAKEKFKSGPVNEKPGKKVKVNLVVVQELDGVRLSQAVADRMSAVIGDLVYLSDSRWWLGGLRSVHSRITEIIPGDSADVNIGEALYREGSLLIKRRHNIEKII